MIPDSKATLPPDVLAFASEKGIADYLSPVLEMTRRVFPRGAKAVYVGEVRGVRSQIYSLPLDGEPRPINSGPGSTSAGVQLSRDGVTAGFTWESAAGPTMISPMKSGSSAAPTPTAGSKTPTTRPSRSGPRPRTAAPAPTSIACPTSTPSASASRSSTAPPRPTTAPSATAAASCSP